MSISSTPVSNVTSTEAAGTVEHPKRSLESRFVRRTALFLFIGVFAFYVAIQRANINSFDGKIMLNVTENLVERGSLNVTVSDLGAIGRPSFYGFGVTAFLIPLYLIQRAVDPGGLVLVSLLSPILLSLSAVVILLLGLEIGWSFRKSLMASLIFSFLTMAPQYSMELFSEPGVVLGTVLQVLGLAKWSRGDSKGPWLAGAGMTLAGFFKPDSLLFGAAAMGAILLGKQRKTMLNWRALLKFLVPAALIVIWIPLYNWIRFGNPLVTGYENTPGFSTPLLYGLGLITVGGEGFFWYNPILILSFIGTPILWRRSPTTTFAILAMVLPRFPVYAVWFSPQGGVSWGPRLLLPLCALLVFPTVEAVSWGWNSGGLRRWAAGSAAALLTAGSAGVVILSIWVPFEQWFNESITPPSTLPEEETADFVTQKIHDFDWDPKQGNIAGNLRLLQRSNPFPLLHFRGGPRPVGIVALFVSAVALTLGWWAARPLNSTRE